MMPPVGTPLDRVDGRKKVTGGAKFAAEHNLENIAYGALVMATIPSGSIRSIHTTAAKKSPGVIAIISHLNAPKWSASEQVGNYAEPQLIPFSDNKVRYVGQRIAIV